jgi:hypothetical protein
VAKGVAFLMALLVTTMVNKHSYHHLETKRLSKLRQEVAILTLGLLIV